jgi:hypothetical protein
VCNLAVVRALPDDERGQFPSTQALSRWPALDDEFLTQDTRFATPHGGEPGMSISTDS